jgi:hypothetical protein
VTTCRSCDAEVVFVPSAKSGAPMILDAKPEKRVVLIDDSPTRSSHQLAFAENPLNAKAHVVSVYTDHHATCPNAADWKGRTRAEGGARV